MATIQKVILEETDTNEVIPKLLELGKACKHVKKFYPSVWEALNQQFKLQYDKDKDLSEKLFEKKLEILLLQDDELRKK